MNLILLAGSQFNSFQVCSVTSISGWLVYLAFLFEEEEHEIKRKGGRMKTEEVTSPVGNLGVGKR